MNEYTITHIWRIPATPIDPNAKNILIRVEETSNPWVFDERYLTDPNHSSAWKTRILDWLAIEGNEITDDPPEE